MAHTDEERRHLGEQLAQARTAAGFSMDAAAAELTRRGCPVAKQTIGAWEKGRNLPDALWLKRLARLYDVSADSLLGMTDDAAWPFRNVTRADILALEPEDRGHLSGLLASEIERLSTKLSDADIAAFRASHVRMTRPVKKRNAA